MFTNYPTNNNRNKMENNNSKSGVEYTWTWNFRRNRAGTPLTEAEARSRHATGEDYIAIIGRSPGTSHPVLVTISGNYGYASTLFLDEHGRPKMEYQFSQKNKDQMFLETVHIWSYADDNPKHTRKDANMIEKYTYREDGYARQEKINAIENFKDIKESTDVPVQNNWEPVPEFGSYESIARWERRPEK
ncbi:hypothetical protein [Streptomonospora sediminis]